jgi:hypothetical protein
MSLYWYIIFRSIDDPQFAQPFTYDPHLGYISSLAFEEQAAVNTHEEVFLWMEVFNSLR